MRFYTSSVTSDQFVMPAQCPLPPPEATELLRGIKWRDGQKVEIAYASQARQLG